MANMMHKPTLYHDPATSWLMKQSKAALADMLTELLRLDSESCDSPATVEAAEKRFAGLLEAREGLRGLPKRIDATSRGKFFAEGGWHNIPSK